MGADTVKLQRGNNIGKNESLAERTHERLGHIQKGLKVGFKGFTPRTSSLQRQPGTCPGLQKAGHAKPMALQEQTRTLPMSLLSSASQPKIWLGSARLCGLAC